MDSSSRVLLKRIHAKDISHDFCTYYGINYESANICRAALLQCSFYQEGEGTKCPYTYKIQRCGAKSSDVGSECHLQKDSSDLQIEVEFPECDIKKEIFVEDFFPATNVVQESAQSIISQEEWVKHGDQSNIKEETFVEDIKMSDNINMDTALLYTTTKQELPGKIPSEINNSKGHDDDITDMCKPSTCYEEEILTSNRFIDSEKRLLQCQRCNYKTVWNCDMKRHVLCHTDKLLHCDQCYFRTLRDDYMEAHMRTHTGNLLQCEHCQFRTAHSFHLKRHMQRHITLATC